MGTVAREPSRDELNEQLRDERRKVAALEERLARAAALEAELAELKAAAPPPASGSALVHLEGEEPEAIAESVTAAIETPPAETPPKRRR